MAERYDPERMTDAIMQAVVDVVVEEHGGGYEYQRPQPMLRHWYILNQATQARAAEVIAATKRIGEVARSMLPTIREFASVLQTAFSNINPNKEDCMYGQNFYEAYVEAMGRAGIGIDEAWEDLYEAEQDAYDEAAQRVIDDYEASAPCETS